MTIHFQRKKKSRGENLRLQEAKGQSIEMAWKVFRSVHLGLNRDETKEKSISSQKSASFF